MKNLRYGDFVAATSRAQREISYNELTPRPRYGLDGHLLPYQPPPLELRPLDVYRLLAPYTWVRLSEQLRSVVPLVLYLVAFQLIVLRSGVQAPWQIGAGLAAVILGLMLFMEGLKKGLMPFGELMGGALPKRLGLPTVLFITFLLGVGVTLAEPAIGVLKAAGSFVNVQKAPYLYLLLNDYSGALVAAVGAGVGLAAVAGTLRFIRGWSLKPLILLTLLPTLGLTAYCATDPELVKLVGLAWDSGAVTTGPVTVPLVLALGIGVAAAAGKGGNPLSGFGIVTLASLLPVTAVLTLGVIVAHHVPAAGIGATSAGSCVLHWYDNSPWAEALAGARAVIPLVLFLLAVIRGVLRQAVPHARVIAYGVTLSLLGMVVFNLGLSYGLSGLGGQTGALIPAAFSPLAAVPGSPLYAYELGIVLALVFAFLLGFGATLAEPALNALGMTVEQLSNGAFPKPVLLYAVSFGVGIGITLGVTKVLGHFSLAEILIPAYTLAAAMTLVSSEEFVNVAWDSAGVTTGPITVPLVLAMGLGIGHATGAIEGFGILALASIGPIISVLGVGLWIRWRLFRSARAETARSQTQTA